MKIIDERLSQLSRSIAFIPGSYYLAKFLYRSFSKLYSKKRKEIWRRINLNGSKINVNIANYMGAMIYWRGSHEWAPIWLLRKLIKPGFVFIDIGANQGEFTINAAKPVTSTGKILAFEPELTTFQQLKNNVEINSYEDRVILFPCALGETEGTFELYTSLETESFGTVHEGLPTMYRSNERDQVMQRIKVEVLDKILDNLKINKVDLIKIDIEGSELPALKGGKDTLSKFKPDLILELNQETYLNAGYSNKELINFVKELGYEVFEIKRRGKLKKLQEPLPDLTNIYCTPSS